MDLGPFDVTPAQIEQLGTRFAEFVNRLLVAEVTAHELQGSSLAITANETTRDGGVDAAIVGAARTDWIPAGDSAWQFKRSNLGPTDCANEFESANHAHTFLAEGGSYRLLIAHDLNHLLLENRRKAVVEKAIDLKLLRADDRERIKVYGASDLARWASNFLALAVDRLLGGPGAAAVDFESWSESRSHRASWVADELRSAAIRAIREEVSSAGVVDLRVHGESGIGKTRLVMEALHDENLRALVAYAADERSVGGELLAYVSQKGRTAILVVDDCPPERHAKLVERLPADPAVKLITLGDEGAATTRAPVISVESLPEAQTAAFLTRNYPQLSPEARRFITDHTRGNTLWTIHFAERILGADAIQAADIIRRNDIEGFVTTLLPEGRTFFLSAVLALVERVGWDRELRPQLELLANFADASVSELEGVGRDLELRGFLVRQGRYRAITPHPLAVFLAAEAWRTEGDRIVTDLLPALDETLALALFRRVADLGRFEPARSVLPRLLAPEGPFGSWRALEEGRRGQLLTQLAIVLPDEVALHLDELIRATTIDELATYTKSRRDLVWTLEKLAWHRRTFASAANSLLRLARAENETWANNATGTWIDLFGTFLPATAATTSERIEYVEHVARSDDAATRAFAVKAATRMLQGMHEAVSVSGELQGGVLVEPRGSAATFEEAGEYRRAAIALLDRLRSDLDTSVADAATSSLIEAIHPLIDDPFVGDALFDVLAQLSGPSLVRLRTNVTSLIQMQRSHGAEPDTERLITKLENLDRALPAASDLEDFFLLLQLRPWDLDEDQLLARIRERLRVFENKGELNRALALLEEQVFAGWFVGRALAEIKPDDETLLRHLTGAFDVNPAALAGYLDGTVNQGVPSAFDDFLAGPMAGSLSDVDRLSLAVRGPATEDAKARIMAIVGTQPVAVGVRHLFIWQRDLKEEEAATLVSDWAERVQSQDDYNSLIDWLNFGPPDQARPEGLREPTYKLLLRRKDFPAMGQQGWDWNQLAKTFPQQHGDELAKLVLDLVEQGQLVALSHNPESEVLIESAEAFPEQVWNEIANRLSGESWRIELEIRGWLLHAIPSEIVQSWVGDGVERARTVASIAPVGTDEPTSIARFLLERFADDQAVAGHLWGNFTSGTWMGPESDRLTVQIQQLNGWRKREESAGVRKWAGEVVQGLETRRHEALEREAEEGY